MLGAGAGEQEPNEEQEEARYIAYMTGDACGKARARARCRDRSEISDHQRSGEVEIYSVCEGAG